MGTSASLNLKRVKYNGQILKILKSNHLKTVIISSLILCYEQRLPFKKTKTFNTHVDKQILSVLIVPT